VVPTPVARGDVIRMASASCIQRTCDPMSRTAFQTEARGARMSVRTRTWGMPRAYEGGRE
jgi:hypothetical protein